MKFTAPLAKLLRRFQNNTGAQRPIRNRLRRLLIEKMEDRRVLATIELGALTAAQGIVVLGADGKDRSGISVSDAGDVNGDGYDDVIIGAYQADAFGNTKDRAGDSYVVFGRATTPATIDLANLGSAGFTIYGSDPFDFSGRSVSGAGDVNGDGFDDLIVGAPLADGSGNAGDLSGESYVIFGGPSLPASINLVSLGSAGITIFGVEANDTSSNAVRRAGDVNGDGFDDLVIGAASADAFGNAKTNAGESYVIFGGSSLPSTINLGNIASLGITVFGSDTFDGSGVAVSGAGDVNGDGFDDLIIGAFHADAFGNAKNDAGESYLIFGGVSMPATIDLHNLGTNGVTIFGVDKDDRSGISVSGAGDVNGDGFDDLIIGANQGDAAGNSKNVAGESYVVFGGSSLPATIDLARGFAGFTIFGADADDSSGGSVGGAGDVNGDGFDDLIIGAVSAHAFGAGEAYVVFGGSSISATIDLANLGAAGITLFGVRADDGAGGSVSGAGDVNGDGFDDFVIGATEARGSGTALYGAGESYVIFGGNFTSSITHQGNALGNTLTGTSTADFMNGAGGNDVLIGNGGADVINGGQGNDVLAYSNSFKRIVGGTGNDTLRMDGAGQVLNLVSLSDNRLEGIEQIDITGSGNNTLVLNFREVLNISDESNTLIVRRNAGDIVDNGGGWSYVSDEMIGGALFNVYAQGSARLKVQFNFTVDLGALTSRQGATIFGAEADDLSGYSVSSAGDVNGDGFDDLIIGASWADASGNVKSLAGESYLIFGAASMSATIDLANLGSAGIIISGADSGDRSGSSVSSAGDVNGDGFDDLVIGAFGADAFGNAKDFAGESYLIFGAVSLPATIDLANLGSAGITIFGVETGDRSGVSVSSAGDINGDGFDDLAIGGLGGDGAGNAKRYAGESYVVFGAATFPATIDLSNLGSAGITFFGADGGDQSGISVSSAGDVNGDGFDDLIIGANLADASNNSLPYAGDCYVFFGSSALPATVDLAILGTAGVTIFGANRDDFSGYPVRKAGDFNGDGFDDLVIGAITADAAGNAKSDAGESYLIFGAATIPATIDLNNLGAAGITFYGAETGDQSGFISGAGDVNGDGFDDLVIGARGADALGNTKSEAGESYVIFGAASFPATIDLANLGSASITILGIDARDYSGDTVSSAGDVNGDGFDDLLIGARTADAAGNAKSSAGESYLIYGNNFTGSITNQGTTADDIVTGTVATNLMNGGLGNDTLVGNGGADILRGGQGNDILAVGDLTFKRIVGGTGKDTLRLDGAGLSLDLTTLSDNRIIGVEQIDIIGSGSNTLTINLREVLNLSDESNTLTVFRDSDDVINLGTGWTHVSNETIGLGVFKVFQQGAARLKVQNIPAKAIDLAVLTEAQGSAVFGADPGDDSGFSVSNAGDVNGDGFDDLIIGARWADGAGNANDRAGESYVFFGGTPLPPTIDLANLGSAGVTIFGSKSPGLSGHVSSAGDVNGDGYADIIIGAIWANASVEQRAGAGESYIIYGGALLPRTIDLGNLGAAGVTILGAGTDDRSGHVSSAGDVNGDGFDDLIIGAYLAEGVGTSTTPTGVSYVIFGGSSLPATIDLGSLGAAGVTILGADAGDDSGWAVSSAGDMNGDGFADLIIGAMFADAFGNAKPNAGETYVIFGSTTLPAIINLAVPGVASITIFGEDPGDNSGWSVEGAGDVNGDGFDDVIIGAPLASGAGNLIQNAGGSYLIFGGSSLPAKIDLSNLGLSGVTFLGADANDICGGSVSGAGDVNGDGFDDLIIGAYFADALGNRKADAGESYVIFGGSTLPATIDLSDLANLGINIFGADSDDRSGSSVSKAGDINGDGFDDFLIGSRLGDAFHNAKLNAGETYILLGSNFTASITHQGTAENDTVTGTPSTDVINGGTGDDILVGNGGADVLIGGQGDDILAVSALAFNRLVGGRGMDTLRLDGSGMMLDLTTLPDNRLLGIEQIDISGSGDNTLTLKQRDVLNISGESNTLVILRNLGDTINIGSGWTLAANERIGVNLFNVYRQGEARLKVQFINQAPTGISLSNNFTAENVSLGTLIGNFSTSDPNLGDTFTYSLVSGSGSNDNASFTIEGNHLKSNAIFDFETKNTYRIRVMTTDAAGLGFEESFTINVTNINEAPSFSLTNVLTSVPESNTSGLDVADVIIFDDALGSNTVTLSGADASMFVLSGGKLKLKPSLLDFESKPTLRVTVSIDDPTVGGTPDKSVDVILRVTDVNEAPGLLLRNVVASVSESNSVGLDVADITVLDDALGTNTLSLSGTNAAQFQISNGKLKLKPGALDFETQPTLRVTVSVDDPAVGSTPDQSINVVLNVTDVNEAPGLVLTNIVSSVAESNTLGLNVADVAISDDALGTNSISLSGPDVAMFEFSSGKLKLKPSALDFETKPTLRVSISVDDPTVGSTPDQVVNIVLNVTDVNEVPKFTLSALASSVAESITTGLNVADIAIQDDALGVNSISLSGPDAAMFQVTGGKLKLRPGLLDFETMPTLRVTVSLDDATVGNSPDQSIDVVLNISDVNEAPTEVVFANILLRMAEGLTLTQAAMVADISVTDDALGTNDLSLQGPDAQHFEIVNKKLRLKVGTRIDFETQSIYQVQVVAKDLSLASSTSVSRDYVLNIDNIPEVVGVTVIDGQGWNESVRQARIQFDTIVNLTNSAIEWTKKDVNSVIVPFVVQTSVVNSRTVADIRFQGVYVDAVGLLDGSYDLMVLGDQVTGAATGFPGFSYTESFMAIRPKPAFAMNISLAPTIAIGAVASLGVQLVGASGTGIRYDIDLDGDGISDRTVLGSTSITLNDVIFAQGGSRTLQITATRSGVKLAQGNAVVDVVPYTVRGSRWISTLDVDADETVSPLDVLGVINWLNDSSSDRRYLLNLDVDRDASISPLDVLAVINHINSEGSGASPSPFVSLVMNDSGASDGLTSNVGIQGRAKETNAKLFLALDGAPRREAVGAINADGSFDLTDAAIAQLFGGSLDGDHLLTIGTVGSDGSWRGMDRRFTRTSRSLNSFELTTALQNSGLSLAWASAGNGSRYRVMRSIEGQSPVVLAEELPALSTRIDLPIGVYDLFVEAYSAWGTKQRSPILRVRIV